MSEPQRPLPLVIVSEEGLDDMLLNLRKNRERLEELEKQSKVVAPSRFFREEPALLSFNFRAYDKGRSDQGVGVRVNEHQMNHLRRNWDAEDTNQEALSLVSEKLCHWIEKHLSDSLVLSWEGGNVARPKSHDGLVDDLMAQCLGAKSYSKWQASALSQATSTVDRGASRFNKAAAFRALPRVGEPGFEFALGVERPVVLDGSGESRVGGAAHGGED